MNKNKKRISTVFVLAALAVAFSVTVLLGGGGIKQVRADGPVPAPPAGETSLAKPDITLNPDNSTAFESNVGPIYSGDILTNLTKFTGAISGQIYPFLLPLALLAIIIGGLQIVTAAGNESKVGAGKKTITLALIGLAVILSANEIVQLVAKMAGGGQVNSVESAKTLFSGIINIILTQAGIVGVLFVVYGGMMIITAFGNESKITNGKKVIQWALIGLVCVVASSTLFNSVQEFVNANKALLPTEGGIKKVILVVINFMLYLSGSLAVLGVIWGGTQYVAAMGSEEKAKKAKQTIIWCLAGMLIVIAAYSIVKLVVNLTYLQ